MTLAFMEKGEPDTQFAAEIAAAETELAEKPEPAPAEPAEPAPEPATEAKPDDTASDILATEPPPTPAPERERGQVPYEAMKAEREQRKVQDREIAELRGQIEAMRGFMQPKAAELDAPEIDPEADPIGALKAIREEMAQLKQAREGQSRQQQMLTQSAAAEQQFAGQHADYPQAVAFARASRANELRAYGFDDMQIATQLKSEELGLIEHCLTARRNPAEVIYETAKARGYAPKPKGSPSSPASPITQAAVPAAAVQPAAPIVPTVEREQAKAAAATSIAAGGRPPRASFDPKDMLEMHGADFDKGWAKMEALAKKRSIFADRR